MMPISSCEEVLLCWKLVSVSICYLIKVAHLIPFTQHYGDSFQVIQTKYDIFVTLKGTVSVISSDSPCKDLKHCLIKNELDISVYYFEN